MTGCTCGGNASLIVADTSRAHGVLVIPVSVSSPQTLASAFFPDPADPATLYAEVATLSTGTYNLVMFRFDAGHVTASTVGVLSGPSLGSTLVSIGGEAVLVRSTTGGLELVSARTGTTRVLSLSLHAPFALLRPAPDHMCF
jgi:hypothetical protein